MIHLFKKIWSTIYSEVLRIIEIISIIIKGEIINLPVILEESLLY